MSASPDDEPPLLRVYRGFLSGATGKRPNGRAAVVGVLFVFCWLALLALLATSKLMARREMLAELRETPEYRCLAAASRTAPPVEWRTFLVSSEPRVWARAATLQGRPGLDCVPDGGAVTYVSIPPTRDMASAQWLRLTGDGVRPIDRRGGGIDIANADGSQIYRNDGQGYRPLPPR